MRHITREEADAWYRQADGKKLGADFSRIDLGNIKISDFKKENGAYVPTSINLLSKNLFGSPKARDDAATYGSITITPPRPDGIVTSGGDTYDFKMHDISRGKGLLGKAEIVARNVETVLGGIRAGNGTPYDIRFYGTNTLGGTSAMPTSSNTPRLLPARGTLIQQAR